MLSYALLLVFIFLLLRDYKKGVIFTAFIVQPLTYIGSGIGEISLYYILAFFALILFSMTPYLKNIKTYPKLLLIPTCLMAISYLVTNSICRKPHTVLIISNIITQFIFPVILWCVLTDDNKLKTAVKLLCYMCVISILVMIPEQVFKHNYFTDLIMHTCVISDFVIDADTIRYGLKRINSIFSYFSTCGMFGYLSAYILWIIGSKYKIRQNYYFALLLLMMFLSFSSGSRATFLGIFCVLIGLFTDSKFQQNNIFKILLGLCILLSPIVVSYVGDILDSMISSDSNKAVTGSSSEMRMLQWEACLPYFEQSPIWGNGRMYIWEEVAPRNPIIQGAESIFFSLTVDYGIMGVITYLIMIVSATILLYKKEPRLAFLPIGYFLILSLSPDAGIQYNLLLTFVILSYKLINTYNNKAM